MPQTPNTLRFVLVIGFVRVRSLQFPLAFSRLQDDTGTWVQGWLLT